MAIKELYHHWKNGELPINLAEELKEIAVDHKMIDDCFYQYVPFGTGGMRGLLGVGTNRMNIFTIHRVAEGLARYIEKNGESAKERGVVIAYDTRHFSFEFAIETARVLGTHGITSYIYKESRPTPQLSFTVRDLHAFAGVVITASHNPKQYNGFKVYGEDGAQLVPAGANAIVEYMNQIDDIFAIRVSDVESLESAGYINWILTDFDEKYMKHLMVLKTNDEIDLDMKIVFTPLHGAGLEPVKAGLNKFGFNNVFLVDEQAIQDGDFPTVTYPNPEETDAFFLAIELGKKLNAELLLATDPDADRLGVAVRRNHTYELLTGNQLGALLLHYILYTKQVNGTLPDNGVILKTIVTSELGSAIAEQFGVSTVNTLTGFKYIAEKIAEFEKSGEYSYLFGYEESYGYLIETFVRDKDAVQVALKVAEMAAYYSLQGKTLLDVLDELYEQYGYYQEALISKVFEGKDGQEQMIAILNDYRKNPPTEIAGNEVVRVEDYLTSIGVNNDGSNDQIKLPKENVLKFILSDHSWIAIRPSGTEPKCKFYFGIVKESKEQAEIAITKLKEYFI